MFKRILSFFKAPWICSVITKTITGIAATLVVLTYIVAQVEGSEVGDKISSVVGEVSGFLESALEALQKATGFICGEVDIEVSSMSLDTALDRLGSVSKELKDI